MVYFSSDPPAPPLSLALSKYMKHSFSLFEKKIFVLPSVSLIEFELIDGECVCCTILLALFGEFCEWAEVVDEPHSIMSFSLFYKWERNCGSSQKLLTAAKVGVIRNVSDT